MDELKRAKVKSVVREAMPPGAGDFTVTAIVNAAIEAASAPSPAVVELVRAARKLVDFIMSDIPNHRLDDEDYVYDELRANGIGALRLREKLAPFSEIAEK